MTLMSASKRYLPACLTGLFIASVCQANAGPQSLLDPYANIQAPDKLHSAGEKKKGKFGLPAMTKAKTPSAKISSPVAQDTNTTTYVTAPGGGTGKAVKKATAPAASSTVVQETASAAQKQEGGVMGNIKNIGGSCTKTMKAATSGAVNATKSLPTAVVSGSKKVGSGIASGAKASGGAIVKGAAFVGNGFKSTGSKLKEGTSKIAGISLPNPLAGKKKNESLNKQSAIAIKNKEQKQNDLNVDNASDYNQGSVASQQTSQTSREIATKPEAAGASKPSKLAGLTHLPQSMSKSISKLNPFNGKAGNKAPEPSRIETTAQAQTENKPSKLAGITHIPQNMGKSISKLNPFNFGKKEIQQQPIAGKKNEPTI